MYIEDTNPSGSPTILLLHGLGTNSSSWRNQSEILVSLGYRPIIPDLPGFGRSPNLAKGWSFKKVVKALHTELHEKGCHQFILVGLSMGGVIAQHYTIDYPEQIQKLVLASTFASLWPDDLKQFNYFLSRFFFTAFLSKNAQAERVGKKIFPKPEHSVQAKQLTQQILEADPVVYRSAMIQLVLHRLGNQLSNFSQPTLVIGGDEDTTVFIQRQQKLSKLIPGASMVIINGGGHGITVDSVEQFNQSFFEFLAD